MRHGLTVRERFLFYALRDRATGCWNWQGAISARDGYPHFGGEGRAYRVAYKLFVGPLVPELEVDHLCNNRRCVNPDHLQQVSHAENLRLAAERRCHCRRGHPYSTENTYFDRRGYRQCRTCARRRALRTYLQKKGSAA